MTLAAMRPAETSTRLGGDADPATDIGWTV
jgi:hypothetical protein